MRRVFPIAVFFVRVEISRTIFVFVPVDLFRSGVFRTGVLKLARAGMATTFDFKYEWFKYAHPLLY